MLDFWWRPLAFVLGLAFIAMLFWAGQGATAAFAVAAGGLLLYVLYHLWQLGRFSRWLGHPETPVPDSDGLWGEAFYRLRKLVRQHQVAGHEATAELDQMLAATRLLPEGVVLLDTQNRIVWLNAAAERHLGLTPQRDIGQFLSYLLRNSRFNEWLAGEDYTQPLTLPSPTDPERILSVRIVPVSPGQRMLLTQNITELVRVDSMRRDFVANVSHELRTPVTVIVGFLEAFADMEQPDPGQFKQHIALMREQSERIRRLVDDLLTLANLESAPEVEDEPVDLPALARRLLEEARSMSHGRHEIELVIDSAAQVLGSSQELYGALANLVSNAVRYTPGGGRITLRWAEAEGGGGEFSVTDTGEGIEPEHIPRLTERFYRVDRGRSRASGGTGLGLAIVKHTLQRHQGRLRIESVVGKGSTFTAALPPERVIPPQEVQAAVEAAGSGGA